MFRFKVLSLALVVTLATWTMPQLSEAGPLLDWLRGRRCCRPFVQQPVAAPCNTCQTTCTQTCQRTVVNYVPYTAYRTSWECVPVTSYRPQSNTDPCTGCTVTCMKPCTTYTYRAKRVPYTTYRPVYSTQSYQVPVTYTSQAPVMQSPVFQAPNTGCNTCQTPVVGGGYVQPTTTVPPITGTINTNGGYTTVPTTGVPTPAANSQPTLNPQLNQRPIIYEQPGQPTTSRLENNNSWPRNNVTPVKDLQPENQWQNDPPQLFPREAKVTESPVYQRFNYTPVRFASTANPGLREAEMNQTDRVEYYGTVTRSGASQPVQQKKKLNQGWRSIAK